MVDFQLTPRQMELRDTAKRFATEVMIPAAEVADRIEDPEASFNWEVIREGSRRGLRTLTVPKEFGGEGADVLSCAIVGETLAYGDLGLAVAFDQTWKIMTSIANMAMRNSKNAGSPKSWMMMNVSWRRPGRNLWREATTSGPTRIPGREFSRMRKKKEIAGC